jgi:hypothetical protein
MIVSNNGYLKLKDVLELKSKGTDFSIYETYKKTNVLVTECFDTNISMYRPKADRIPYKDVEGKSITSGKKIFDSRTDSLESINFTKWNNGNQIMSYNLFRIW